MTYWISIFHCTNGFILLMCLVFLWLIIFILLNLLHSHIFHNNSFSTLNLSNIINLSLCFCLQLVEEEAIKGVITLNEDYETRYLSLTSEVAASFFHFIISTIICFSPWPKVFYEHTTQIATIVGYTTIVSFTLSTSR